MPVVQGSHLAVIEAEACIGCMLCISTCPTHAIEGEAKQPHSVIAAECTGCGLCSPACPVDCISLIPHRTEGGALPRPVMSDVLRQKIVAARAQARRRHGKS